MAVVAPSAWMSAGSLVSVKPNPGSPLRVRSGPSYPSASAFPALLADDLGAPAPRWPLLQSPWLPEGTVRAPLCVELLKLQRLSGSKGAQSIRPDPRRGKTAGNRISILRQSRGYLERAGSTHLFAAVFSAGAHRHTSAWTHERAGTRARMPRARPADARRSSRSAVPARGPAPMRPADACAVPARTPACAHCEDGGRSRGAFWQAGSTLRLPIIEQRSKKCRSQAPPGRLWILIRLKIALVNCSFI